MVKLANEINSTHTFARKKPPMIMNPTGLSMTDSSNVWWVKKQSSAWQEKSRSKTDFFQECTFRRKKIERNLPEPSSSSQQTTFHLLLILCERQAVFNFGSTKPDNSSPGSVFSIVLYADTILGIWSCVKCLIPANIASNECAMQVCMQDHI